MLIRALRPAECNLGAGVVAMQVAAAALEHIDRGKRQRPGAAHAAAEREGFARPRVVGTERADPGELVVRDLANARGELVFAMALEHLCQRGALDPIWTMSPT